VFFITKGKVSFVLSEEHPIPFKDMLNGAYFGEIEILDKTLRKFVVTAAVHSEFLTLSRQIMETLIWDEYPEVREEMIFLALERKKRIKMARKRLRELEGGPSPSLGRI